MTIQALKEAIIVLQSELDSLALVQPKDNEEFTSLRFHYDLVATRLQGYQMQMQTIDMITQLEEKEPVV